MAMTTQELSEQVYTSALQRHGVPVHLRNGLLRYVVDGRLPGDFLVAVLENDLAAAVGRADDESLAELKAIVQFIYHDVPSPAWGSPAKVEEWIKAKRAERTASVT